MSHDFKVDDPVSEESGGLIRHGIVTRVNPRTAATPTVRVRWNHNNEEEAIPVGRLKKDPDPGAWAAQTGDPKTLAEVAARFPQLYAIYKSLCITVPGSVVVSWQRREPFRREVEALEATLWDGRGLPMGEYTLHIVEVGVTDMRESGRQRLTIKNKVIAGPDGSDRFQGQELINAFLIAEKSWVFIRRLFRACGLPLDERPILDSEALLRAAQKLPGLRYDATVKRVGARGEYMSVTNERPTLAESPYR